MRRSTLAIAVLVLVFAANCAGAVTSSDILKRVKAAESRVKDIKADMVITEANKGNVSRMGKGYGDILMLQKAKVYYQQPDRIRFDGYAKGIKVTYIQNGYKKLILAAMIRKVEDAKNDPGKRQDSLDLGFLSSRLWTDNYVKVISTESNGVVKLKFDPKHGDKDKRHDMVWVDPNTLKVIRRQKFRGSGELRVKNVYSDFVMLGGKLPIATESKMYNGAGQMLGSVKYTNVKANTGLKDSLFSLSTK